ncbi:hypothetical protein QE397_000376 [Rhodococcus sp. SORGH_AS 301]|nr:hypothetical protein [Rhodococcus sp. SORGH_AS_0301]
MLALYVATRTVRGSPGGSSAAGALQAVIVRTDAARSTRVSRMVRDAIAPP